MALNLNTIKAVKIDGKSCGFDVNPEQRLRIQQLKFNTAANIEQGVKVLVDCFDAEVKAYVEEKLPKMAPMDLMRLQAYMVSGDSGVEMINRQLEKSLDKALEEAKETRNE